MNLITGNPYGFQRFARALQDNSLKLAVYMFFFWRLAKWGTEDARDLLKRIGMQERYLSWQQARLLNKTQMTGVAAGTSGLLFNTMQQKKAPFQLSEYVGRVNSAIRTRKSRLQVIKWYTYLMKSVFDTIMKVLRNPIYFFDVALVLYWMPRLDFILKAILTFLRGFSRIFGGNRRALNQRAADNENNARRRAARRVAMDHLVLLH